MTELDTVWSVGGSMPVDPGEAPRTLPRGRVCFEPECDTVLSIYNETNYCALHQPGPIGVTDSIRARRQRRVA